MDCRTGFARSTAALLLGSVTLLVCAASVHAELPVGWSVDVFAGRIHDLDTSGGVIACATDGGLLFYEPASGTYAQIADAGCTNGNCLRSNRLTAVQRDPNGQYWLGTESAGVAVFRPAVENRQYGHFFVENLSFGGGLLSDSVTAIDVWQDETVYVATTAGVAQIDLAGAVETYNPDASRRSGVDLPGGLIHDLVADSTWVWVASDSGMVRYQRRPPFAVQRLSTGLEGQAAFCVRKLAGVIHVGTDLGLHRWDQSNSRWQRIRNVPGAPEPTPDIAVLGFDLVTGSDNPRFLVASDTEMWFFNGFVWSKLSPPGLLLLEQRVFEVVAAQGDTLWTSPGNANGEGDFLWSWNTTTGWVHHARSSIPPSEVNFVDVDDRNGDIWVGTRIGGVARRTLAGNWCVFNGNDPEVAANMTDGEGRVESFLVDRAGTVWFATLPLEAAGTVDRIVSAASDCRHANDVWEHVEPGEFGFGGRYWEIVEDGTGNRFFLSDGGLPSPGGLDVLSENKQQWVNVGPELLQGSAVGAIAFRTRLGEWREAYVGVNNRGSEGLLLWLNSNDLFTPTSTNFSELPLDLEVTEYRALVVDPDDRTILWVGTDNGIFQYDTVSRSILRSIGVKFDAKPGLLSPDIKDLVIDDFGNLWIATVNGLNRINLRDLAGGSLQVEAFSTREMITQLNESAPPSVGRLYDPSRTVAPLPAPIVNKLSYDGARKRLYIATDAGLAMAEVSILGVPPVIPLVRAFVYPNPVRVLDGDEEVRLADVSEPATVTIYNLEGEVVFQTFNVEEGDVAWDLGTFGGLQGRYLATSGLYMVRIETSQGMKMSPLVVIR